MLTLGCGMATRLQFLCQMAPKGDEIAIQSQQHVRDQLTYNTRPQIRYHLSDDEDDGTDILSKQEQAQGTST
jgi:hypothetical protein